MQVDGSAGELGRLLGRSSRAWQNVLAGHVVGLGVTPRQAPVLAALVEGDQVWTESRLVAALGQAHQTVSTTVAGLEAEGLVERVLVQIGGRQLHQVRTTSLVRGPELLQAMQRAQAEFVVGLTSEQLATLRAALLCMTGAQLVPAQGRGEVSTA